MLDVECKGFKIFLFLFNKISVLFYSGNSNFDNIDDGW